VIITGHATNVRLLASILLLALTWLSRPAPADPAAIDTTRLYGTWLAQESHPEQGKIETVFTIFEDRTFSGTMTVNGEVVWTYGGTWTLENSRMTWHYSRSSLALLDVHRQETDEILSVTDETLTYRSLNRDSVSTLRRLDP
jgi:hypothetical protein